jgi:aryl-alcohol dehydrogenase-like predicted oxidoreductase
LEKDEFMRYRVLGSTGLKVSVIGLGTWQLGGEWGRSYSQGEVDAILGQAAELGINLIDTAECYGDHLSERLIGDYLGISISGKGSQRQAREAPRVGAEVLQVIYNRLDRRPEQMYFPRAQAEHLD